MNRVRQPRPAAHADDWLITYADMITLLLCFFVIFFVILSSRKNGQDDSFAARALAPLAHATQQIQPPRALPQATRPDGGISARDGIDNPADNLADEVAARIGNPLGAGPEAKPTAQNGEPKGKRISLMEISSSAFFRSGSADLSESGKSILRDIAIELTSKQYEGYRITVEGHTDDTPIATTRFSSNWELSTARASAVVHFFLDRGVAAQRLRAAGYADTEPKLPNRDAQGNAIPENQAQNRRVVIELEKIETPQ